MDDEMTPKRPPGLGLPIVTAATIDECVLRNEDQGFLHQVLRTIESENPTLFYHIWETQYHTEEERTIAAATLIRVYAILAVQYERDLRRPQN